MAERDPTGMDSKQPGAKMDAGKAPVFQGVLDYFPRAVKAVSQVSAGGARKYSWKGWETVPDGINRYNNAGARHITDLSIQGEYDPEGFRHRAQIAWNFLAALELQLRQEEAEDDARRKSESTSDRIAETARSLQAHAGAERTRRTRARLPRVQSRSVRRSRDKKSRR